MKNYEKLVKNYEKEEEYFEGVYNKKYTKYEKRMKRLKKMKVLF